MAVTEDGAAVTGMGMGTSMRSGGRRLDFRAEDWQKPWAEQRLRVLTVAVEQRGSELYTAELADHHKAVTASANVDPDGIEPTVQPSGPSCDAEVPGRVRLEVPDTDQDLILRNDRMVHNPPLYPGTFRQKPPAGVRIRYAACGG